MAKFNNVIIIGAGHLAGSVAAKIAELDTNMQVEIISPTQAQQMGLNSRPEPIVRPIIPEEQLTYFKAPLTRRERRALARKKN